MDELKRVVKCRKEILGSEYKPITGLCLSSRRNLCINSKIDIQNANTHVDISFLYSLLGIFHSYDECYNCRKASMNKNMVKREYAAKSMDIEDLGCCYYEKTGNGKIPCYPKEVYPFVFTSH